MTLIDLHRQLTTNRIQISLESLISALKHLGIHVPPNSANEFPIVDSNGDIYERVVGLLNTPNNDTTPTQPRPDTPSATRTTTPTEFNTTSRSDHTTRTDLVIVAPPNGGKTTFLIALGRLLREDPRVFSNWDVTISPVFAHWVKTYIDPAIFDASQFDAKIKTTPEAALQEIELCKLTSNEPGRENEIIHLFSFDVSGEKWTKLFERDQGAKQELSDRLTQAKGIMIMIAAEAPSKGERSDNTHTHRLIKERLFWEDLILSLKQASASQKIAQPLAIVLTKADLLDELWKPPGTSESRSRTGDDPSQAKTTGGVGTLEDRTKSAKEYIKERHPKLFWNFDSSTHPDNRNFFAISSKGINQEGQTEPANWESFGVQEPIEWLADRMIRHTAQSGTSFVRLFKKYILLSISLILLSLLVSLLVWNTYVNGKLQAAIKSENHADIYSSLTFLNETPIDRIGCRLGVINHQRRQENVLKQLVDFGARKVRVGEVESGFRYLNTAVDLNRDLNLGDQLIDILSKDFSVAVHERAIDLELQHDWTGTIDFLTACSNRCRAVQVFKVIADDFAKARDNESSDEDLSFEDLKIKLQSLLINNRFEACYTCIKQATNHPVNPRLLDKIKTQFYLVVLSEIAFNIDRHLFERARQLAKAPSIESHANITLRRHFITILFSVASNQLASVPIESLPKREDFETWLADLTQAGATVEEQGQFQMCLSTSLQTRLLSILETNAPFALEGRRIEGVLSTTPTNWPIDEVRLRKIYDAILSAALQELGISARSGELGAASNCLKRALFATRNLQGKDSAISSSVVAASRDALKFGFEPLTQDLLSETIRFMDITKIPGRDIVAIYGGLAALRLKNGVDIDKAIANLKVALEVKPGDRQLKILLEHAESVQDMRFVSDVNHPNTRAFYIDTYEVSWTDYADFCRQTFDHAWVTFRSSKDNDIYKTLPAIFKRNQRLAPDVPITQVSWFDAYAYAQFRKKRLPTDSEWITAYGNHRYPSGDELDGTKCNFRGTNTVNYGTGHRDFTNDCSPFGVRNMAGNVREWTMTGIPSDSHDSYIVKGLSFLFQPQSNLLDRTFGQPVHASDKRPDIGFRCVVDPLPEGITPLVLLESNGTFQSK